MKISKTTATAYETDVTTPPGWEAFVSMLGNPEAFKMCVCVCVQLVSNVCIHVQKTLRHPGYKGYGCIFHTNAAVCVMYKTPSVPLKYLKL